MQITKEQFEEKCYNAYQLDWMISHGYSLADYRTLIAELAGMNLEEDTASNMPTNSEETKELINSADEIFQDTGFGGELFASKDEFLDTEYLDAGYMNELLSAMYDKENSRKMWECFTGMKLSSKIVLQSRNEYVMPIKSGYLSIYASMDKEYPGVDIEYISNKESEMPDDDLYTRPRVLIEENKEVLRAVIWGDHKSEDYSDEVEFMCVEDMDK